MRSQRTAPAPGGLRATPRRPADESLARHLRWPTWKEGQAAPRRRPQPFSRIFTAWKVYSANFALTAFTWSSGEPRLCELVWCDA